MLQTRPGRRSSRVGFHGWRVSLAGAAIWALQSLIWVQGFGNLAVVLREQFGWSKTFFSIAFSITRFEGAALSVPVGKSLPRWGIRRIMRIGAVLQMVGFIALSQIRSQATFLAAIIVIAAGATLAGFLTITAATVAWFERKRAKALSYNSMGFALGGFAGPAVVWAFTAYGWRWTLALAGILLGVVVWGLAGVMGVSREALGQPVDGIPPEESIQEPRAEGVQDFHFTARQAAKTSAFWFIALGHGSALLVVSSVMAHLQLFLTEDRGYSPGAAAFIAGLVPLFQFVGTFAGGILGDLFNKRLISSIAMFMHGLGLLVLAYGTSASFIGAFVVLHGLAWGARGPQMSALRADYFGTTHFAEIMAWNAAIITIGSIGGPLLAGWLADRTGSYQLGFTIIAVATMVALLFFVFASPPSPPDSVASSDARQDLL